MRRLLLLAAPIAVFLVVLMAGTGLAAATPLLGDPSVGSAQDNVAAGLAEAFPFGASASGDAQSISVYVDSGSRASGLAVGVYADNGGHPGSLLASGSTSAVVAGAWNDVTLNSTPTLWSGTTYWLAVLGTGGQLNFRDVNRGTGRCSENSSQSDLTSLPSGWTSGPTFTTCSLSAYVNGAASPPTTSAPANTVLPMISGTAQQGQTLVATSGTWANNVASYLYAWEDCDSSGDNCVIIGGATASGYTLQASDVGATLRSVVTASNSGGSVSARSAATAVVAAEPPAAFSFAPASPTTGQNVHFDASSSSCPDGPCTYTWSDNPPSGGSWALGTGQTLDFVFRGTGTKYVTLTVTDASNNSATVEHDVVVTTAQTVSAPSNTALPVISGTTTQGQTLTTSNGTWNGSPTGYAYQWRQCDNAGNSCTDISGATSATYTLATGDTGHTLRAAVTATNTGGSTPATSAASAVIAAAGTQQTNCVSHPSTCGYPDATNSGVPAGVQLTARSGNITANVAGQTISNIDLTNGTIVVTANNVTIKDSRITTGNGQLNGVSAVDVKPGVTGTLVEDTTMQGSNCTSGSLFAGVMNESGDQQTLLRDYATCIDDILHGSGTIKDSYSIDNSNIPNDHYEPVAYDGGDGSITIIHNTLLNPHDQTAAVFVTCYFGPVTSETIDNNLMAGGDYVIYGPEGNGACNSQTGHQEVIGNRFSKTYFSAGGQYGIDAYFQGGNTTWSGNYWDENLAVASM